MRQYVCIFQVQAFSSALDSFFSIVFRFYHKTHHQLGYTQLKLKQVCTA